MKNGNEICAKCDKPKSKHRGRRMTVHPYGWELACTVNGMDHFTPRETVSVPKDFVEAVRHMIYCEGEGQSIQKVQSMLDQIDGKDGGE